MKYITFLFLTSSLFLFASPAYASENWVINNFQSEIAIQEDGKVRVVEKIEADFGNLQKHGIYREVPYVYQLSDGGKRYTEIKVNSVTSNGSSIPYETSQTGGYVRLQIGDPDKTVSGKQTYSIDYTATGILNSFENHDELYWNVTSNRWPVPIERARSTVTLPGDGITQITCYEGALGSKESCGSEQTSKIEATFVSSRNLAESEGLTVVVGYTKGLVPVIVVPPPKSIWDNMFTLWNLLALKLAFLLTAGIAVWLWWKSGRDFWWRRRFLYDPAAKEETRPVGGHDPVVVEYDPPEKLRPAEVGALIDERADTLDVTATIIDLATRGFLKITEEPKKWAFGSIDYVLTKITKDVGELLPYEKELLIRIFEDGDIVKISSLKTKFYKDLAAVKKNLYQDVVDKKFFTEDPEKVRMKYLLVAIVVGSLAVLLIVGGFVAMVSLLVALGAGVVFGSVVLLIVSQMMPRKTANGHEMWRRVKGYELFISKAERYRQQFFERRNMFNEILPYAIVFGVTEKFAQAFKDMGIEPPQPTWYSGTTPFNAMVLGSSISSFSSSLSSAMAAAPGGSGFSGGGGGGGFSGGGFGGGGGGSW